MHKVNLDVHYTHALTQRMGSFKKEAKMKTHSDVLQAKRNENEAFQARHAKANANLAKRIAKFTPRTDLHPSVGVLINAKGVTYYAYVGGVYREGTPEHLESLLTVQWKHNAPFNSEFLGAQPACNGQDY